VIVRGFKKCYLTNIMAGTDDDILWSDSKESGNVSSKCEENEGSDCEGGRLTDDEDGESDSDW
jgi:hypothetical protein